MLGLVGLVVMDSGAAIIVVVVSSLRHLLLRLLSLGGVGRRSFAPVVWLALLSGGGL